MAQLRNRTEAGVLLAEKLKDLVKEDNLIVLGLPRGGIPVAAEVAKALRAPLDVFLVRKLGLPWHKELAMGAIASGDVITFNEEVLRGYPVDSGQIQRIIDIEKKELERRNQVYRQGRELPDVADKTVILVDDGIATGATMKAAIQSLRQLQCKKIIVAVPVCPPDTKASIESMVEKFVCLLEPAYFMAIGQFYADFAQLTDEEVIKFLST